MEESIKQTTQAAETETTAAGKRKISRWRIMPDIIFATVR